MLLFKAYHFMQQEFKQLETAVIQTMITAHIADYGRELSEIESIDCNKTICQLKKEIEYRKSVLFLQLLSKNKLKNDF